MSHVVSVCVMVAGDDEPNKVEFVLIDICGKLLKHCIDIISHRILCIVCDTIYIYDMYSYLCIYVSMFKM